MLSDLVFTMSSSTRQKQLSSGEYNLLGCDKLMSETVLPTTVDVMQHYYFEWQDQKRKDNGKNPGFSSIADITLEKVKLLWQIEGFHSST